MKKFNNYMFLIWGMFFIVIGLLAEDAIFALVIGGSSIALFVFYTLSDRRKEQRNKMESSETKQTESQPKKAEPVKSMPFETKRAIKQPVVKRRTSFEYSYDELPKMNFSELRKNCDSEDAFEIPELSEEEIDKLREMSRTFWAGDSHILQESSGNLEQDRYVGMLRLYEYIRSWRGYGDSFFANTNVKNGLLEYCYNKKDGYCYDGGCCGEEITYYYLCIKKIPSNELEIEFRKKWNTQHNEFPGLLAYRGDLSGTDCMAFYTGWELWVKQPFGLADGFYIYTKNC